MSSSESQFTATAGEHFVAYHVASFGFVPALVRQAVRTFDLLASTPDGARSIGLLVKTSLQARREIAGEGDVVEFPFSPRAVQRMASTALFCFVDLQGRAPGRMPDVFVIPMDILKAEFADVRAPKYLQPRYSRAAAAMEVFRNNWQPLFNALTGGPFSPARILEEIEREQHEAERSARRAAASRNTPHTSHHEVLSLRRVPDPCVAAAGEL